MKNRVKGLIKGAVIILIAAPFFFAGDSMAQELFKLSLKSNVNASLTLLTRKQEVFDFCHPELVSRSNDMQMLKQVPKGLQHENDIYDSTSDSNITVVKPKDPTLSKFRMKKSPTKAVLFSAILPGAGQFYNESYWKIPIIGGLVGYFGYEYFRNNNLFKDYRDQYLATQTEVNPDGDFNLKTLREFYRNQRDDFVWYFLIVYVINMVDAYVDAHLFDFDVREEKYTKTGTIGKEYRLKLNIKF